MPESWLDPAGHCSPLNQETEASIRSCDQVTVRKTKEGLGALRLSCRYRNQNEHPGPPQPETPHLSFPPESLGSFVLSVSPPSRPEQEGSRACKLWVQLSLVALPVSGPVFAHPGNGHGVSSGAIVHSGDMDRDTEHPQKQARAPSPQPATRNMHVNEMAPSLLCWEPAESWHLSPEDMLAQNTPVPHASKPQTRSRWPEPGWEGAMQNPNK